MVDYDSMDERVRADEVYAMDRNKQDNTIQGLISQIGLWSKENARLKDQLKKAKAYIDANVCDPDINQKMIDTYHDYQKAMGYIK
jgi:hypothetical protein